MCNEEGREDIRPTKAEQGASCLSPSSLYSLRGCLSQHNSLRITYVGLPWNKLDVNVLFADEDDEA